MKESLWFLIVCAVAILAVRAQTVPTSPFARNTKGQDLGWYDTNAIRTDPQLAAGIRRQITNNYANSGKLADMLAVIDAIQGSNQPPASVPPVGAGSPASVPSVGSYWTNSSFAPESLLNACWTNYLAKTNGRQFQLWGAYTLPIGWPLKYSGLPVLAWADNCLVRGAVGLPALCQCHTAQLSRGQIPMIAVTPRHVIACGHGMGVATLTNGPVVFDYPGVKLYFCTADNTVVEATTVRKAVYYTTDGLDFSVISLAADLPASIRPIRCINPAQAAPRFPMPWIPGGPPQPLIGTRQTGFLDCGLNSGHTEVVQGGDSGSPEYLWLGNELFFTWAISGSGPASPQAQVAVDMLTGLLGLPAANYQIQYVDVSSYPTYP